MVKSLAERMRANPRGDWTIRDIEAVCRAFGFRCAPPRGGGSHYKVSHPSLRDILTIPNRRPVKAVYVRKLMDLIDSARQGTGK
jgi:hypothetical protein